jgi:hypothetical protein
MDLKLYNEQEFDKLCAEFVGWEFVYKKGYVNGYSTINNNFIGYQYIPTIHLKFHSDWNWIMEVRNKILSINQYSETGQRFTFSLNATTKFRKNENDKPFKVRVKGVSISYPRPFIEVNSFDEKEAVVQAIWEFLQWYNEQKHETLKRN